MIRKSIRDFSDRRVSDELVHELVEHSLQSPSSCNLQLTEFIYLNDRQIIKSLANRCSKKFLWSSQWLVVICDTRLTYERNANFISAGIAIGNLLDKANQMKIDTCPVAGFVNDKYIKKKLKIPSFYKICLAIALGYKASDSLLNTPRNQKEKLINSCKNLFSFSSVDSNIKKWNSNEIDEYRSRIFPVYSKRLHMTPFGDDITNNFYKHLKINYSQCILLFPWDPEIIKKIISLGVKKLYIYDRYSIVFREIDNYLKEKKKEGSLKVIRIKDLHELDTINNLSIIITPYYTYQHKSVMKKVDSWLDQKYLEKDKDINIFSFTTNSPLFLIFRILRFFGINKDVYHKSFFYRIGPFPSRSFKPSILKNNNFSIKNNNFSILLKLVLVKFQSKVGLPNLIKNILNFIFNDIDYYKLKSDS